MLYTLLADWLISVCQRRRQVRMGWLRLRPAKRSTVLLFVTAIVLPTSALVSRVRTSRYSRRPQQQRLPGICQRDQHHSQAKATEAAGLERNRIENTAATTVTDHDDFAAAVGGDDDDGPAVSYMTTEFCGRSLVVLDRCYCADTGRVAVS